MPTKWSVTSGPHIPCRNTSTVGAPAPRSRSTTNVCVHPPGVSQDTLIPGGTAVFVGVTVLVGVFVVVFVGVLVLVLVAVLDGVLEGVLVPVGVTKGVRVTVGVRVIVGVLDAV